MAIVAFALLLLALLAIVQLFPSRRAIWAPMVAVVPGAVLFILLPLAVGTVLAARACRVARGLSRVGAAIVLLSAVGFIFVLAAALAMSR